MSRLTINSNITSLNTQRNFGIATKKLFETYTRLSSGLRINKSSDDAAGLSISETLKSDTRISNQGIRNLNDGLSLLSIADGAIGELSNITIRLRELATQSANGTLSAKQRVALDQEAQALAKEFNRIARLSEFNGKRIFDADFGTLNLAAGGGSESLISSDLGGSIGDGTFKARYTLGTVSNPRSVEVGDFNNDGIDDLVAAYEFNHTLNIFLGKGDGTFNSAQSYGTGLRPTSVSFGDFNSDGVIDLVSTDITSFTISIFLGNSDGTFKNRQSFNTGLAPNDTVVGDFNNDGALDLISADSSNHVARVFFGNNDGTLKTGQAYATGIAPLGINLGDFNNDGILDLASADASGNTLSILLGNSDGSFKTRQSFATGTSPRSVAVGDFNGDGILDLASADSGSNTVSLLLGNSNGTFQARQSFASGSSPYTVAMGDFNGDGISDLVTGDLNSSTASVFLGNSNGSFKARQSFATGLNPYSVAIGDFNNDGVLDLVSPDASANTLSILLGSSFAGVSALHSFSLKTKSEAKNALTYLESVFTRITGQRGQIGAFQSRIETAINNLQQKALAYQEANSRITDADIAEESSKLVANQIVQQVASSLLAQANLQPQLVLSILKGI